jgi:hypothetical protein
VQTENIGKEVASHNKVRKGYDFYGIVIPQLARGY